MSEASPSGIIVRRRARWPYGVVGLIVMLAAVWSGLWVFASGQAGAGLDRWLQAEASHGRIWTCPDRSLRGFPLGFELHCTKPTFHGEIAGRMSSANVETLDARLDLFHPRSVAVRLRGPLVLRADDDEYKVLASWEALQVMLDPFPGARDGAGLEATRLALTISPQHGDDLNLRSGRLRGEARPVEGDAAWTFAAAAVSFPTVDALTGSEEPFEVTGHGALIHAALLNAPTASNLERWRLAGGQLDLADLTLSKGDFNGQAKGTLALDGNHRPAGRLETSLQGFGPIAEKLGIPVAGVKIGSLLSSLLSGKPAPPQPVAADAVRLPLILADGHVSVGVFQTPVRLDPFY